MEEGTNTRFVVTNKPDEPDELYAHYTERGETENRIKDLKVALKADRLSCHRFVANQFRLLLHAAAYWLMDTLRKKLVDGGIERMQLDTLRLKLVKIGGSSENSLRRSACIWPRDIRDDTYGTLFRELSESFMNNSG